MLFLDVNKNNFDNAERLQEMLDNKKNVFVLVYMIGCTPCKNTLPEWNKLKECNELNHYKKNDDIIVANVEQSMCEKMHHKELEHIMSFPTIKHIKHNDVHNYNDERTTKAFSKWINSLVKEDSEMNDINDFVIASQDKTNYGNIDTLFRNKPRTRTKTRTRTRARNKRKTTKIKPIKSKKSQSRLKSKSQTKSQSKSQSKQKRKKYNKTKARRIFQSPLMYTKSLPV